jgi:hypothetical protein
MRSKHLLSIATPLHRLQHRLEVTMYQPFASACRFGETHLLKYDQSCVDVWFSRPSCTFIKPTHYEIVGGGEKGYQFGG